MDYQPGLRTTIAQKQPPFIRRHCFRANFVTIYSFFFWTSHIFIHSIIHSNVCWKYSFKEYIHSTKKENYPFKEFIHSIQSKIVHSKKIFIQVKNGLSPRANHCHLQHHPLLISDHLKKNRLLYLPSYLPTYRPTYLCAPCEPLLPLTPLTW